MLGGDYLSIVDWMKALNGLKDWRKSYGQSPTAQVIREKSVVSLEEILTI